MVVRECLERVADAISDTRVDLSNYIDDTSAFPDELAAGIFQAWETGLSTSLSDGRRTNTGPRSLRRRNVDLR